MNNKGKLFIVSAPSGAGKTTLCNMLMSKYPSIKYSVSHTTREPRKDEVDGKDYFFINEKTFKDMIDNGEFIEWASVHGNYYGTSGKFIDDAISKGENVILDIDPQGARQLKAKLGYGTYIFIVAPSIKDLEIRLRNRRTETEEKLKTRLDNARKEILLYKEYDYIILNKSFEKAFLELESIYISEHLKTQDLVKITNIVDLGV